MLLFITNLRVFFVHHVRRDPLVVLAPFTFIVAILQILAWGIDVFTVLGLLIALFVFCDIYYQFLTIFVMPPYLTGRKLSISK